MHWSLLSRELISGGTFKAERQSSSLEAPFTASVVDQGVDERAGHDVVTEDLAPVLEAFVAREDGGGVLVAAGSA